MTGNESRLPCDRWYCFRQAQWIIVNMPPAADVELERLGLLEGALDEMFLGQKANEESADAALSALVHTAGRTGGKAEILCEKHADVSMESIARNPRRLPIRIDKYIQMFGLPGLRKRRHSDRSSSSTGRVQELNALAEDLVAEQFWSHLAGSPGQSLSAALRSLANAVSAEAKAHGIHASDETTVQVVCQIVLERRLATRELILSALEELGYI